MRSFSFICWLFLFCIASTLLIAEPGDQLINKVNKTLSTSGSPTKITGGLVNTHISFDLDLHLVSFDKTIEVCACF